MTYQFRQGIDYGPRNGTLGLSLHMSEGGDGLVGFLGRHSGETLAQWAARVNGVSCHAALLSDGTIWQMLDWDHASGNLNPADRADEYGYYGGHHLRDVLGAYWPDPNTWTVSMEIAGYRTVGPTDRQRDAAIRWGLEMRAMFPTIRGATGHHDQSPKPCPGLTPNMKAIFAGVGGHGLFQEDSMARFVNANGLNASSGRLVSLPVGADLQWLDGKPYGSGKVTAPLTVPHGGVVDALAGHRLVLIRAAAPYADGIARDTWLVAIGGTELDAPDPCADAVGAEHEQSFDAAVAAVEAAR